MSATKKEPRNWHALNAIQRQAGPMRNTREKRRKQKLTEIIDEQLEGIVYPEEILDEETEREIRALMECATSGSDLEKDF